MSSDDRLVELVIDGDDAAFELLYARHVADALAFADGLLGSREEAEEAVRHSFAAARAYLADGGRKTAFEPWLYTILDNHCLSMLQRRRGEPEVSEAEDATVVDLDDWRQRRKLLGGGLAFAPSPGFNDSVMTACGIGGGTATAAAPLLGGTLAKVAVVALLAGGAGVAGDAVSDRTGPADAGVAPAPSVRTADAHVPWPMGVPGRQRDPDRPTRDAAGSSGPPPGLGVGDSPLLAEGGELAATLEGAPANRPSSGHVTVDSGDDTSLPVTPTSGDLPVDAPALPPADRIAPELTERLKARLPRLDEAPRIKLPAEVKPPKIDLPKVVKPPKVDLPSVKPPKVDLPPTVVEPPEVVDDEDVPSGESSIHARALSLLGAAGPRM